MKNDERKRREEIINIINEIDRILFDCEEYVQNRGFRPFAIESFIGASIGASVGVVIAPDSNVVAACAGIGYVLSTAVNYYVDHKMTHYYFYQQAYNSLSREQQIKVLQLSRELLNHYRQDSISGQNRRFIKNYLEIGGKNTRGADSIFEEYESHPQFDDLTDEEVMAIHERGNLTPREKYDEWVRYKYCPNNTTRNECHDNCRDCRVGLAITHDEWAPVDFENYSTDDVAISQKVKTLSHEKK